jgi:arylsulfatase A
MCNRRSVRRLPIAKILLVLVGFFGIAVQARAQVAPARRPNIVFILADDLGIDGVSCYGGDRFRTTNIDALAQGGVRFQTCLATPLCGPSRCEIMTGRYSFRTGGLTNVSWLGGHGPSPRTGEIPIATVLKNAGYATGHAGNWRQLNLTPRDWGFDEYATDAPRRSTPTTSRTWTNRWAGSWRRWRGWGRAATR